ncbi:hypothetical protein EV424DRAFT_1547973 [Suillus variegatus]|nr:hypothetical protein EV424DRAFT_1547973 [Suillus variegatus]
MSSPSVEALIKGFFNDPDLGKVFAIRSKHPTKNRRAQYSSTTHHEGHDSISADIPMHLGSLAGDLGLAVSSATASHGKPFTRTSFNMTQTFLPGVQAAAGAIPVTGPPIHAAIGELLAILQTVDRRCQNKADLERLRTQLCRLSLYLYNALPLQDPFEQDRRDAILKILLDIHAKATRLYNRGLACTSVTQDIIGCSSEIDDYLADFSVVFYSLKIWSSRMQNQYDIHEVLAILRRRQQGFVGPTSMRSTALHCVKLVDATGHQHTIPVTFCTSFQQLNNMLQVLFKSESTEARIQRRYMEQGQYDLCIDNDKQVTQLTSHEWPRIEAGTTIVMRVILEQETRPKVEYQCHFCGAVNRIGTEHSPQHQAGYSINCRRCKRRFQISRGYSLKRKTQSCVDRIPGTEAETHLIRNFHVQQTRNNPNPNLHADGALASRSQVLVCVIVFGPAYPTLMVLWPRPTLSFACSRRLAYLLDADGVLAVSRSQLEVRVLVF